MMKKEYYDQLKLDFEWIRRKEWFNAEEIARVSNMSALYLNNPIGCQTCGNNNKTKWDLIGWLSVTIDNVENGVIQLENENTPALLTEKTVETLNDNSRVEENVREVKYCVKCNRKLNPMNKGNMCTKCKKEI